MVLAILLEMTSPTRSLRLPRAAAGAVVGCRCRSSLSHTKSIRRAVFLRSCGDAGFDARDVAAQGAQARGLFQLRAGLLQAQIEHLLAQVAALRPAIPAASFLSFLFVDIFFALSPAGDAK